MKHILYSNLITLVRVSFFFFALDRLQHKFCPSFFCGEHFFRFIYYFAITIKKRRSVILFLARILSHFIIFWCLRSVGEKLWKNLEISLRVVIPKKNRMLFLIPTDRRLWWLEGKNDERKREAAQYCDENDRWRHARQASNCRAAVRRNS